MTKPVISILRAKEDGTFEVLLAVRDYISTDGSSLFSRIAAIQTELTEKNPQEQFLLSSQIPLQATYTDRN